MYRLSNELLLETYAKAKELQLNDLFINLIIDEVNERELTEAEANWLNKIQSNHSKANVI